MSGAVVAQRSRRGVSERAQQGPTRQGAAVSNVRSASGSAGASWSLCPGGDASWSSARPRRTAALLASYVAGPGLGRAGAGGYSKPRASCMLGTGRAVLADRGAGRGRTIIASFLSHHSHLQCGAPSPGVCENGACGNKRCLAGRPARDGGRRAAGEQMQTDQLCRATKPI